VVEEVCLDYGNECGGHRIRTCPFEGEEDEAEEVAEEAEEDSEAIDTKLLPEKSLNWVSLNTRVRMTWFAHRQVTRFLTSMHLCSMRDSSRLGRLRKSWVRSIRSCSL